MEQAAKTFTLYASHAVEIFAALVIGVAVVKTLLAYVKTMSARKEIISTEEIRLQFGSSVAVALELLLGADVLATAVAPGWDAIGKLAAITVLRTGLNYFLEKELKRLYEANGNPGTDRQNGNYAAKSFVQEKL